MAQRVVLLDDFTGEEGAESIAYSLDGVSYEIDLSEDNAAQFRGFFAKYTDVSRCVAGRASNTSRSYTPSSNVNPEIAKIRVWAGSNGYDVGDRGRIPAHVTEAYEAAMRYAPSTDPVTNDENQ
jgi:hypothetical protein